MHTLVLNEHGILGVSGLLALYTLIQVTQLGLIRPQLVFHGSPLLSLNHLQRAAMLAWIGGLDWTVAMVSGFRLATNLRHCLQNLGGIIIKLLPQFCARGISCQHLKVQARLLLPLIRLCCCSKQMLHLRLVDFQCSCRLFHMHTACL